MTLIKIALRNLGRHKTRTALLSMAIIISLAFIFFLNGFIGSIVLNIGRNASHLLAGHIFIEAVHKSEDGHKYEYLKNPDKIETVVNDSDLDVKFLTRRSAIEHCTLIFQGETVQQGVVGADWVREKFFIERIPIQKGSFNLTKKKNGIIISKVISEKLKADLGDIIIGKFKTYSGQHNAADFEIVAITSDSGLIGSSIAYSNLSYVNELINLQPKEYMTLGIYLNNMNKDFSRLDVLGENLYNKLQKDFDLFDRSKAGENSNPIQVMLQQFKKSDWIGTKYALSTLNDGLSVIQDISLWINLIGYIILVILLCVVLIGLFNTFWIVMLERTKEIGTLRAIGMQRPAVFRMLIVESLFLGLIGIVGGSLMALFIMLIVNSIDFGTDKIYFIIMKSGHITFHMPWWQILLNIVIVLTITLLGAIFPAYRASKLSPAEAFRSIH